MKKLPKPKDRMGYSIGELVKICNALDIKIEDFNVAFGINTVGMAKDGTSRFYVCDVERALYELGSKLGKGHLWD